MPPPTSQEGIGLSSGSRLPTSTVLSILPGISRVPTVRLQSPVGLRTARAVGVVDTCTVRCHSLAQGGFGGLTMGQREATLFVRQTNSSCLRPSWQSWQT